VVVVKMGVNTVYNMADFESALRGAGRRLVVVDFYADWCGPCRAIAPRMQALSDKYAGSCVFLKVNVDEARDIATHCAVRAMPTFHFYLNQRKVDDFAGADPSRLENTISRLAPSSKDISFSGEGQRLGGSSTASAAPVIDWGNVKVPTTSTSSASQQQKPTGDDAVNGSGTANGEKSSGAAQEVVAVAVEEEGAASASPQKRVAVDEGKKGQLMEMGFSEVRAVKALVRTRENGSVEAAAEWIFEHMDDADIDEAVPQDELDAAAAAVPGTGGGAASTLTQEEQRAKALELLEKARVKRAEEEKAREAERERNRIKSGKEVSAAKAKYDEEQRRRDIAARKKEKADALAEKQRLRELLKQDQEARKLKFAPKAAPVEAQPAVVSAPGNGGAPASGGKSSSAGTIELRFPDGSRAQSRFEASQTVGDVFDFVQQERGEFGSGVELVSSYPRRVFRASDCATALSETALLPRGALNVRRA